MLNFELINIHNDHNFSIGDIEAMFPYERDIYVALIHKYMAEKQKITEQ